MNVPIVDLKSQYRSIQKEVDAAFTSIINKGQFAGGEEIEKFEREFADYHNAKYCISLNSGTDALILGLRALDLPPGSEIIVPSFTFIATAIAALENRLKPVFVDISKNDYGISLDDLKKKINSRTKAITLVHLYGQPDRIEEVKDTIKKSGKKIYLIEDACQAHGAEYKGKRIGTFGSFSAFSFYPTKNLGAYGDGGAILTNNKNLAAKYRLLKQYGQEKRYYSKTDGINSRLDTIQAAILRVKLKHLDRWNRIRVKLAQTYTNNLLQYRLPLRTPPDEKERPSVYHLYVIRTKKRNQLSYFLKTKNIATLIHYPIPLHLQQVYRKFGYLKGDLPNSEKAANEVLTLPFYAEMPEIFIKQIAKSIAEFYQH